VKFQLEALNIHNQNTSYIFFYLQLNRKKLRLWLRATIVSCRRSALRPCDPAARLPSLASSHTHTEGNLAQTPRHLGKETSRVARLALPGFAHLSGAIAPPVTRTPLTSDGPLQQSRPCSPKSTREKGRFISPCEPTVGYKRGSVLRTTTSGGVAFLTPHIPAPAPALAPHDVPLSTLAVAFAVRWPSGSRKCRSDDLGLDYDALWTPTLDADADARGSCCGRQPPKAPPVRRVPPQIGEGAAGAAAAGVNRRRSSSTLISASTPPPCVDEC